MDRTGVGKDANLKNTYPWGEGSEDKERECEGVERDTCVDEAFWGGPEHLGAEPERRKEEGEGRRVEKLLSEELER